MATDSQTTSPDSTGNRNNPQPQAILGSPNPAERPAALPLRACGGCMRIQVGELRRLCQTCGQGLWDGAAHLEWDEEVIAVLHVGRIYRFAAAEAGPELQQMAIEAQALPEPVDLPLPPSGLTEEAKVYAVRLATERLRAQMGTSNPPETTTPDPSRVGHETQAIDYDAHVFE
jgi:hypothetical protein